MTTAQLRIAPTGSTVVLFWRERLSGLSYGSGVGGPPEGKKQAWVWDVETGDERLDLDGGGTFSPDGQVLLQFTYRSPDGKRGEQSYLLGTNVKDGSERFAIPLQANLIKTEELRFRSGSTASNWKFVPLSAELKGIRSHTGKLDGVANEKLGVFPPSIWQGPIALHTLGRTAFASEGTIRVLMNQENGLNPHLSARRDTVELRLPFDSSTTSGIYRLGFSPDGNRIAGMNSSGIYIWDLRDEGRFRTQLLPDCRAVSFSPDQQTLMLSRNVTPHQPKGSQLRILIDTNTWRETGRFLSSSTRVVDHKHPERFTPDSSRIVCFGSTEIIERDSRTGAIVLRYPAPGVWSEQIRPSAVRKKEGLFAEDDTPLTPDTLIYDVIDLPRRRVAVQPFVSHSDTPRQNSTGESAPIRILEGPDWKEICRLPNLGKVIFQTTPDGRFLIANPESMLKTATLQLLRENQDPRHVFDLTTGRKSTQLRLPPLPLEEFSPDGRYALAAEYLVSTYAPLKDHQYPFNIPSITNRRRKVVWDLLDGRELLDSVDRPVEDWSWFRGSYWRYRLLKYLSEAGMEIPLNAATESGFRFGINEVYSGGTPSVLIRIYDGSPFEERKK